MIHERTQKTLLFFNISLEQKIEMAKIIQMSLDT